MTPAGYSYQAAMVTVFTMKNLLRAPGKKDELARLCLNKRVTHTYLQAALLRLLVSCQMIIFSFFLSKTKDSVSFSNFVRFTCICSTV